MRDPPGSAWIGMGKPARSESPGQLGHPGVLLRALLLLLFCRHGKELRGQRQVPGQDTGGDNPGRAGQSGPSS